MCRGSADCCEGGSCRGAGAVGGPGRWHGTRREQLGEGEGRCPMQDIILKGEATASADGLAVGVKQGGVKDGSKGRYLMGS